MLGDLNQVLEAPMGLGKTHASHYRAGTYCRPNFSNVNWRLLLFFPLVFGSVDQENRGRTLFPEHNAGELRHAHPIT